MTTFELLSYLRGLGVEVWSEGQRLRLNAPAGVLTPTLREQVSARQAEILSFVARATRTAVAPPAAPALTPLPPGSRNTALPLSYAQRRLWFLDQLQPGSPVYNVPGAIHLSGPLSVPALAGAFAEIVRRHEVLRTTFASASSGPVQWISPCAAVDLPVVDLSGLPAADAEVEGLVRSEALRPFDLARGPLLRVGLLVLGPEEHVALVTMHHIVSDAWSLGILVRELGVLYRAGSRGEPSPLSTPRLQYADYAAWQRSWLKGQVLESQLAYWRQQLRGAPPVLELPADRPRPAVRSQRGAARPVVLPAALATELGALARRESATPFMVLLAAFQVLMSRCSRQEDLCIGTPIAGRNRVETEEIIGFFINTLVLRTDLSGRPDFLALLGRVRKVTLGAYRHQEVPFEKLVEELHPERSLSHTPLVQVAFALQNVPQEALELAKLRLRPLPPPADVAKFDMLLTLTESRDGIAGTLEYATDLFDATTVERIVGHFGRLLVGVVEKPRSGIGELPLLGNGELQQVLREWSGAVPAPGEGRCLHRLFEAQAARTPGAVALIAGERQMNYAELDGRADRLAAHLRGLGVGAEVRVALWLDRTVELVVAILGVLKAGGAYVPIDPSYPEERLRFLLADAGAPVVVSVSGLCGRLGEVQGVATVLLDRLAESGPLPPVPPAPDLPPDLPTSTAYVIYTSGSTGQPKGVPVSHANVRRLFSSTARWFGFGQGDVWTLFHSYAFDFSVWELWGALLYGGRLVVVPYWVSRSPEAFYELLVREQVTVLNQTPSAFYPLAAVEEEREAGGRLGELSLRWVIFGGEALEPGRLSGWFARHGERRPTLVNMYGITETTVHVTYRPLRRCDVAGGGVIGVPIPDLYVQLLDGEGEPVPIGVAGEIHVGGAGVARGYLGRSELTAERFVPDPFAGWPGARLYASGDLARRRPDGELEYLGRADQQVKIRGFRIEPGEIEAALVQHPGIREAVVLARDGEEGRRLVAWLGMGGGPAPGADELREFLQPRLPEHMIPAVFVALQTLPLSAHGKIDRRALPEPEAVRPELGADYAAPRTPEEAALAAVWAEVLGMDRVGIHDNYFALGGDSIRSVRVLALAEARGLRFSLPQLFQHQTIAELVANRLAAPAMAAMSAPMERSGPLSLVTAAERAALRPEVEDAYPLSALQLGMLYHSGYGDQGSAYHNVATVRLSRVLDAVALRTAAARLAERHAILRTSFDLGSFSRPLQLVRRAVEVPVTVEDLGDLGAADREAAVARRFAEEKAQSFEWDKPPLLRFHVQHLGGGETQLFWTEHHAILDGWSVAVLLAELFQLYQATLAGGAMSPPPPPPLTTFRDFIALERAAMESEEARDFWMQQLRDMEPARLLPWHPDEENKDRTPLNVPLPPAVLAGLRDFAAVTGVPLKNLFLAAHVWVVGRMSGTRDVVTGLVTNGRPEAADADRVLGLFLNTVPLRAALAGGTWSDLARQMLAAEREILPFRRFPLPDIQRDIGATQLFETSFNFVHFYVMAAAQQASGSQLDSGRSFSETNIPLAVDFDQDSVRDVVRLNAQRDPAVVNQAQLRTIVDLYLRVLAAMAADPMERYETADLLALAERQQIVAEWNDTALVSHLQSELVHEVFAEWAARTPEAPALLGSGGELSYRELNRWANRIARRLLAGGAGPEVAVGLYVERSPEMIAGVLGILKAGAAYVPLDPSYPRERLLGMIADLGMPLALTQQRLAEDFAGLVGEVIAIDGLGPSSGRDDADPVSGASADNLAYAIFTSGSTGRPKAVGVSHRALSHHMAGTREVLRMGEHRGDRVLQFSTLNFDGSVDQIFIAFFNGGCLALREEEMWSAEQLEARIGEMGLTIIDLPTGYWSEWVRARSALAEREGGETLRVVYVGGEAMLSEELSVWWRSPRNRTVRLLNAYGPTETVVAASYLEATSREAAGPLFERVAIGRPLRGRSLHVVDAEGRLAPVGVPGELLIGGEPILARGYLGRPELTAERFVPDPFSLQPGARLYRTGDLGRYLPDGRREFLGRVDDQVKVRGFRIELGEVEAALAEHPAVHRAAAVVHGRSQNERRLVAYATPAEGAHPTAAELRSYLRGKLPEPMVPSDVVLLDRLPLTPNGKVDRRALPAPELSTRRRAGAVQAPRNDVELQLVGIWEELLAVHPIGVTDDFLELGGHSLLAVRLMARIEHVFGVKLPISALFEAPTVERLAELLRRGAAPARRSPLVRLHPGGAGRPLFVVHPVGGDVFAYVELARQLGAERPVYGLQATGATDGSRALAMEELAAQYLAAVRQVQGEGPWLLAGWSLGAVIAYEMAQQIDRDGGSVALLAMLDPSSPAADRNEGIDDASLLAGFAADLVRLSGRRVTFGQEVLAGLTVDAGLDRLIELGRSEGVLPPDVDGPRLRERFDLFGRHVKALQSYAPRPYGGRVTLFRASGSLAPAATDSTLGWCTFTPAEVHLLDADHYSLLQRPVLDRLMERLRDDLAAAEQQIYKEAT